jgi:hypothetical protein
MPAIDPARLDRELESVVQLVSHPEEAARACLTLLDFYADRTRRPTLTTTADLEQKFGVPGPVVRELSHRLSTAARALPDRGDSLADVLWGSGYRETRLAAGAIYEHRDDETAPAWVAARARECRDPVVLEHLGSRALLAWRAGDPDGFLAHVWSWLDEGDSQLTVVALTALCEAVRQPGYALAPSLFEGLAERLGGLAATSSRLLGELVRLMAARSPAETAQLLKRVIRESEGGQAVAATIDAALPHFPERQRMLLRSALSDARPA